MRLRIVLAVAATVVYRGRVDVTALARHTRYFR
jgi:hypothetical protein